MTPARSAIVLGGGLAGIAAAVRLAELGVEVTLLETRKRLGGRATSHLDPATGELIDNCQHVVLGCCTNLLDLYQRLDSTLAIEWHDRMYFADKQGRRWTFTDAPLPAPLHLSRALLGYKGLSLGDRLHIGRTMGAMMRARRGEFETITFGVYLDRRRTSALAIDRFWNPIVRSACNLPVETVSAASAMQVFQQGFMAHRDGWRLGTATIALADLYEHTEPILKDSGGKVRTGTGVASLCADGPRVTGVMTTQGESINADVVISALPADRLAKVASDALREVDPRLAALDRIDTSPIIGMHLWLDRPVLTTPNLFFTDGAIDWLFAAPHQPTDGTQHLHTGISAAQDRVGMATDDMLEMAMGELRAYAEALPGAAGAKLLRGHVIREKRATFAATPGIDALRPATVGSTTNLLLAGDWTATGWPSTMEGAVRSGYAAAGAAVGRDLRVADLPPALLYRLLTRRG